MVETRGTRGGRRGRAPRGRGRRGGRITSAESEPRIPVQEDVVVEDRAETPIQQPTPVVQQPIRVDQAGLLEMMRTLAREVAVPPQTDWVKAVGQCRPPFFYGARDEDIEMWFREIESVFDMVAVPEDVRCRLAAGLLRRDVFDSWTIRKVDQPEWTYADFKAAMLREYNPPGIQMARETTFYRGAFDRSTPISEVVRQFKRELVYCSHLCPTDESRIRLLSMRLSPEVLLHTSTLGNVTFE